MAGVIYSGVASLWQEENHLARWGEREEGAEALAARSSSLWSEAGWECRRRILHQSLTRESMHA